MYDILEKYTAEIASTQAEEKRAIGLKRGDWAKRKKPRPAARLWEVEALGERYGEQHSK